MPTVSRAAWARMTLALVMLGGCQSSPKSSPAPRGRTAPPSMMGKNANPAPRLEIPDQRQTATAGRPGQVAQAAHPPRNEPPAAKPPAESVIRATTPQVQPPALPDEDAASATVPARQEAGNETASAGPDSARREAPSGQEPPALRRPVDEPPTSPSQSNEAKLRELHQQAATKYAGMHDYIARFRRREVIAAKQQPEELMMVRFKKPFSIYFKWLEGGAFEGREAIYVQGKFNNEIQTKTGRGDGLSGIRVSVPPHSERATKSSRRTIDEAGLGNLIGRFGTVLAAHESGARTFGPLHYAGTQQRPECPVPMDCVVQQVPPGVEKHLPKGGTRYWFFNADSQAREHALPTLIITHDENRREVEYYCHDRLNINVGLRDEEFEPEAVWSNGRR